MSPSELGNTLVSDLMSYWPKTMQVFMRRHMSCPGCLMATFMTVADAAKEYDIAIEDLTADLLSVIEHPQVRNSERPAW